LTQAFIMPFYNSLSGLCEASYISECYLLDRMRQSVFKFNSQTIFTLNTLLKRNAYRARLYVPFRWDSGLKGFIYE